MEMKIPSGSGMTHDQQLYINEYNSYITIIEYQQINIEVIFCLAEVEDI